MKEEKKKIKIKKKGEEASTSMPSPSGEEKEVFNLLSRATNIFDKIESMKGVTLEIDELTLEGVIPPYELLSKVLSAAPPLAPAPPSEAVPEAPPPSPPKLEEFKFETPVNRYEGEFITAKIGSTKEEGGTRAFSLLVGGNNVPQFHTFEGSLAHRPVIAHIVFDEDPGLPKIIKKYYEDVIGDPVKWAKKCAEEYNAKMIFLDLNSTNPKGTNRSAEEAAETVKEVLKAVKVPLIIGVRSGVTKKDVEVLKKCAEVASGENVILFNSSFYLPPMLGFGVTLADDIIETYETAAKYGHFGVNFASLNLPGVPALNMTAMEKGLQKDKLLTDIGTMPVGYAPDLMVSGLDSICAKAFSNDENYQAPLILSPANTYIYREGYAEEEGWGNAKHRGTAWEVATAMTCLISGAHILVMLNQEAIRMVESFLDRVYVQKIENVNDLLRNLLGIDCKGCKYEGCKEFAEAVMKGKEDIEKCTKLGEGGKESIKRLINPPKETICKPEEISEWIKKI